VDLGVGLDRCGKSRLRQDSIAEPVASRYTYCAIPAHNGCVNTARYFARITSTTTRESTWSEYCEDRDALD
jgi:hypothetical protein